ncbi:GNAT family N-acetyltransferase [Brevibacillus brevis]|uniref:GNAT family N-acetyltransferase n=1 Tax=Brevibacillus brevis TaxID=1393 RepID=UPI0025A5465A|nr:GNAT family N-acetyltransferase [Brevibacillus brevis]WJQ81540.1 GNAT family N-acetyltransferase [Brevibacillus brevis]
MKTFYRISKLTKSDKPAFVSLMSRAFSRDPFFLHVFGDSELDHTARKSVTAFLSFLFDKSFLFHEEVWGIFDEDSLLGTYVVEKPQTNKHSNIKGGFLLIGRLIPLVFQLPGKTLILLNSYMRITRSAAPPWKHHYLIMIGVKPETQGKGVGKTLMQHLFQTIKEDHESQGIALDTEKEENVGLYQKLGFTLQEQTKIDDVPVYCMVYQKNR